MSLTVFVIAISKRLGLELWKKILNNWKNIVALALILFPTLLFIYYTAFDNWLLWFWAYQNIFVFEIVSNLVLLPLGFFLLTKNNWQKSSIRKLAVFVATMIVVVLALCLVIAIVGNKEKAALTVNDATYYLMVGGESYFSTTLYKCAFADLFCTKIQQWPKSYSGSTQLKLEVDNQKLDVVVEGEPKFSVNLAK